MRSKQRDGISSQNVHNGQPWTKLSKFCFHACNNVDRDLLWFWSCHSDNIAGAIFIALLRAGKLTSTRWYFGRYQIIVILTYRLTFEAIPSAANKWEDALCCKIRNKEGCGSMPQQQQWWLHSCKNVCATGKRDDRGEPFLTDPSWKGLAPCKQ